MADHLEELFKNIDAQDIPPEVRRPLWAMAYAKSHARVAARVCASALGLESSQPGPFDAMLSTYPDADCLASSPFQRDALLWFRSILAYGQSSRRDIIR